MFVHIHFAQTVFLSDSFLKDNAALIYISISEI